MVHVFSPCLVSEHNIRVCFGRHFGARTRLVTHTHTHTAHNTQTHTPHSTHTDTHTEHTHTEHTQTHTHSTDTNTAFWGTDQVCLDELAPEREDVLAYSCSRCFSIGIAAASPFFLTRLAYSCSRCFSIGIAAVSPFFLTRLAYSCSRYSP